jgi:hypothetical protein
MILNNVETIDEIESDIDENDDEKSKKIAEIEFNVEILKRDFNKMLKNTKLNERKDKTHMLQFNGNMHLVK